LIFCLELTGWCFLFAISEKSVTTDSEGGLAIRYRAEGRDLPLELPYPWFFQSSFDVRLWF
jgi:hypothetical protein